MVSHIHCSSRLSYSVRQRTSVLAMEVSVLMLRQIKITANMYVI